MRTLLTAAILALFSGPVLAAPLCDKLGFSGLLAKCNRGDTIEVTLSSGKPLGEGPVILESGAYYEMEITADGTAEIGLTGPEFFRAIWMDEIVINDIEVRPMAIDSFEFDDAGTAEFSFIAIKPGRYHVLVPGTTGESQRLEIRIQ